MQRLWSADELDEHWTLGPEELKLLAELTGAGKLGLAAQLAYWRQHGRFPNEEAELAPAVRLGLFRREVFQGLQHWPNPTQNSKPPWTGGVRLSEREQAE